LADNKISFALQFPLKGVAEGVGWMVKGIVPPPNPVVFLVCLTLGMVKQICSRFL